MITKGLETLTGKKTIFGIFKKIMNGLKIDIVKNVIKLAIGAITIIRLVSDMLSEITYNLIKKVSSAVLKPLLAPFIGPFAWLVTMVLEIGVDIIDMWFGLKSKISDFINWILESSWSNVCSFVKEIGGK